MPRRRLRVSQPSAPQATPREPTQCPAGDSGRADLIPSEATPPAPSLLPEGGRRAPSPCLHPLRPGSDTRLTGVRRHAVLRIVTDTYVRLWRRVHMDLVRYAGCVCRPSC
ncbi:putative leader peptide [Streptomyces tricolor]